jgi:hypothetical protein
VVTHLIWFCVIVLGAAGTIAAAHLTLAVVPTPQRLGVTGRSAILTVVGAGVSLLVLGGLWRTHGIAKADGRAVARLAGDRGSTLDSILSVVTTMGDLVPCFVIATVLAVLLYQRLRSWTVIVLPVIVLLQVAIQIAFTKAFKDNTIHDVAPHVVLGGYGAIPSGSVSRLLSIFLIAALLWQRYDPRGARRLVDYSLVLVVVELVTRLYLGRHLLGDIAGGLLLGVCLAVVFGWILHEVDLRWPARNVTRSAR